jgi:ABC-2 type transport system permease protein
LSEAIIPASQAAAEAEMAIRQFQIQRIISHFSPMTLYSDATSLILNPMSQTTNPLAYALMGPLERLSAARFQGALQISQSLFIVAPYLISIIAITLLCFGICYYIFMRQEIRSV